jgi:DNA-binding LacI/PurR family transcriptional regulator
MGGKKTTIKDVAKEAGVSISVVSYILNNTPGQSFPDETRKKIIDIAKKMQYTPSYFAKGMRSRKSMNIGIVLFWAIGDTIVNEFLLGVSKITEQFDYNIVLCIPSEKKNEFNYADIYRQQQIDGIIFISPFSTERNYSEEMHINLIKEAKIPAVIVNGITNDESLNYIYIDFYSSTYLATKYLAEYGHKKIAYLLPSQLETTYIQVNERRNGFNDAIKSLGAKGEIIDSNNLEELAKNIKNGSGPTAIVLNKINYAKEFYTQMQEFGIRIPEDISVIAASDDNTAEYFNKPLTTVKIPLREMGETGAKVLFDILNNDDSKLRLKLANSIVERGSCKKI